MRLLAALALLVPASAVTAQEVTERFHGYAYHLDSGRYAFTEVTERRLAGGTWVGGTTRYFLPDGRALGHKTLDFTQDPFVPVYRLDLAGGYSEGITDAGAIVRMIRQTRTATVDKSGLITADAGLPRLLRAHFDTLLRGAALQFRVVAPTRLAAYKFRAVRIPDAPFEGRPATRIQVDLDSMLKLFAGPLQFAFDPVTQRLLEFRGTTNVLDPAARQPFVVRIAYFSAPPAGAPVLPK